MKPILVFLFLLLLIVGCGTSNEDTLTDNPGTIAYEYEVLETNQEGDFELVLLKESENTFYTAITYLGDEKEVEIVHSAKVFSGVIYDDNENIEAYIDVDDIEISTTLTANEPFYENLQIDNIIEKLDAFQIDLEASFGVSDNRFEIPLSHKVEH